jgi:hypothetical protein
MIIIGGMTELYETIKPRQEYLPLYPTTFITFSPGAWWGSIQQFRFHPLPGEYEHWLHVRSGCTEANFYSCSGPLVLPKTVLQPASFLSGNNFYFDLETVEIPVSSQL